MTLTNIDKSYFNKGVFVFENGNYIFIEEIQYSHDGSYWESTFKPETHIDPRDASSTIEGHKYRRVRHALDDSFQLPEYIVAEDGKTPLFTLQNDGLYMKYEGEEDSAFTKLIDLDLITGPKGDIGVKGEGWHIDAVGYWMTKPDCNSGLTGTTSCTSCSGGTTTVTSGNPYLFLSMGDGLYTMVSGDVTSNYFRSDDGITWIAIVATDVGNTTRWIANDGVGTGAIDYREQDSLGTKGKVYYCNGTSWELLFNVAVPRHQVSPTAAYYGASQSGFFMEDYVGTPLNANYISDTIVLTADYKLVVKKDTLEPAHFKDGSFSDGFNEGIAHLTEGIKTSNIVIAPDDFAGFGLRTYTSGADTYLDMQIYTPDIVQDGLASYDDSLNNADGEVRYKMQVRPADLVDTTLSGLTTFTNVGDGFDDFKVLIKAGLEITTTGIQPLVDDLSLELDAVTGKLQVKESTSTSEGILPKHISTDSGNTAKAIEIDHTDGIGVILSATQQAIDFDGTNGLFVKNEGIVGYHLSSDIADVNKGIKMDTTADKLEVLLQSAGGLRFNASGGIEVDPLNLTWLTNVVVNKIEVDGADYQGDIVLTNAAAGSDSYMDIDVSAAGQVITVTPSTNVANLTSLIQTEIAGAASNSHTHTLSQITDASDKVDSSIQIGNIMIATNGLFIRNASDNAWGRLESVNDSFDLGVNPAVAPIL